ncbi:MAG: hypothetical protein SCARUB_02262 [Candidatus Scalindua rubra]|uniref:Uncharacterized protein n=1 Tax=Candidatus Scalindua rubra TaxID=1872076 RepID=A0A1E3XAI0_9BACT|nr:MAG: hypothetical protein SCARUB_02262 [Candidatus Scalindua rubra]
MNPFQSLREYEEFIYTLKQRHQSVQRSTLIVARRGKRTAIVLGEITFAKGYRITLRERISFDVERVVIESYGYELWCHGEKFAWYDSQPHTNDPNLVVTNPHHKHIPPNIKHNRAPAPDMHFDQPNLQFLIQEIESLLKK